MFGPRILFRGIVLMDFPPIFLFLAPEFLSAIKITKNPKTSEKKKKKPKDSEEYLDQRF